MAAAGAVGVCADEKPVKARQPVLTTTLSVDRVRVGDEVTLTETMPLSAKTAVVGFAHKVLRIGVDDSERGRLILLDKADFEAVTTPPQDEPESRVFEGANFLQALSVSKPLDRFWMTPEKGMSFKDNMVTKGRVVRFKPLKPGIYLIVSVWNDRSRGDLESNPVILSVDPKAK